MGNLTENANLCGLKREDFQTTVNGKKTDLYILRNRKGFEVAITNYGGAICSIMVPDKEGKVGNVIQGHGNIQSVIDSPEPYLSTLIGRFGNRICRGQFTLNGKDYQLAINNGPNALHGGPTGFHARVWDARQMGPRSLALHRVSSYGEEGFTGEVDVTVEFTWSDDNAGNDSSKRQDRDFGLLRNLGEMAICRYLANSFAVRMHRRIVGDGIGLRDLRGGGKQDFYKSRDEWTDPRKHRFLGE